MGLKAQEVTIMLKPGWTWICYPSADTVDFATALGAFSPLEGDIIACEYDISEYFNGEWMGDIQHFYPGYGYMYYSSRPMPVFLTFNPQQPAPQGDDHEYVDLGLPSGTLWATCNVGANAPEEYGDYFAWGETEPKDYYDWSTYQYCNGSYNTLTKYCSNSNYGYIGFTDSITTLLSEDDAATANWGADWRMPTKEEWQELYNNTTVIWTTLNGVNGKLFTASNGNSIFLPATGYRGEDSLYSIGLHGYYWTSSLYTYQSNAWDFHFNSFNCSAFHSVRSFGESVRPVRYTPQNNNPIGAINGKFTINANGDQIYFSKGNLQYIGSASTPYWKFADNQWDYLGDNGQGSEDQDVDRDLFGWGTSGYNHNNRNFQPWCISTNSWDYYAYGVYNNNLYDQTGQADWGYNPISNGGNQECFGWRTLTHEEWTYLFETRTTNSGILYVMGKVNGINGVILLPDSWIPSIYPLNSSNVNDFDGNTISEEDWINIFEVNGAVFLPASGGRYGNAFSFLGSNGYYWSSSFCSYYNGLYSYRMCFGSNGIYQNYNECCYGYSVRLVRDAE